MCVKQWSTVGDFFDVAEAVAVDEKTSVTVAEAVPVDRRFRNKKIEKKKDLKIL